MGSSVITLGKKERTPPKGFFEEPKNHINGPPCPLLGFKLHIFLGTRVGMPPWQLLATIACHNSILLDHPSSCTSTFLIISTVISHCVPKLHNIQTWYPISHGHLDGSTSRIITTSLHGYAARSNLYLTHIKSIKLWSSRDSYHF